MSTDLDAQHLYTSSWENKSPNKKILRKNKQTPSKLTFRKPPKGKAEKKKEKERENKKSKRK